jgi:hypothetical protein
MEESEASSAKATAIGRNAAANRPPAITPDVSVIRRKPITELLAE